ncbi:MAG: hypothetical protein VYC73_04390 [Candidatus Thermoplasmatota archaeon]|nr:hypothetical protein [Candidatus Thermoplasmatota archaeon]
MNRIAVLCGTGMSAFSTALASSVEATSEVVNVESKWGNVPINVVRTLSGKVFVIDRHHSPGEKRTPPHAIEHRANVYAASSCKPDLLVSVNSVGSMIETMPPGTIGVGSGMLDLSEKPWTFHDEDAFHSDRTNPFDNLYSDICAKTLTVKQGGAPPRVVVVQCIGPQFESPHEIDAIERLGANVVGMTLGPEQRLVSETGIPHVSLLCSSNWAAGRTPGEPDAEIDHESVDSMASNMRDLVSNCIIALLSGDL